MSETVIRGACIGTLPGVMVHPWDAAVSENEWRLQQRDEGPDGGARAQQLRPLHQLSSP